MSKKIKWPDDKKANKLIYSLIKKQVTKKQSRRLS